MVGPSLSGLSVRFWLSTRLQLPTWMRDDWLIDILSTSVRCFSTQSYGASRFWGPQNSWAEELFFIIFGDVLMENTARHVVQIIRIARTLFPILGTNGKPVELCTDLPTNLQGFTKWRNIGPIFAVYGGVPLSNARSKVRTQLRWCGKFYYSRM